MPLPVSTLAALILMSRTPLVASGEVKTMDASHLSKVPSIATDASTWNVTLLSTGVILKTGTPEASCAARVPAARNTKAAKRNSKNFLRLQLLFISFSCTAEGQQGLAL